MSIYVARSPYFSSYKAKPGKVGIFTRIGGLLAKKPARRYRLAKPQFAPTLPRIETRTESRGNLAKTIHEKKQQLLSYQFGPSTVIVGLILASVLLSVLYLMHFNQVATKGYDLKRIESSHKQLMDQYDIGNIKLAEAKSLNTMIESGRMEGMRRPKDVIYVRGSTALASR